MKQPVELNNMKQPVELNNMKQPVEDIQNRVRNHLSVFQIMTDIFEDLQNTNDEEKINSIVQYIKNTNISKYAHQQIDWFILLGKAMDNKIANKSFDVEKYINEIK